LTPAQTQPWEVFLIDPSFIIERPKRLYRKTINSVTLGAFRKDGDADALADAGDARPEDEQAPKRDKAGGVGDPNDPSTTDLAKSNPEELRDASSHTFYIKNTQTRLKLVAKNERQMDQFIASIERMAKRSIWGGENRFGSFAPIRLNVAAQWLVDGVRSDIAVCRRSALNNLAARLLLEPEPCHPPG
jgi:phospholipase D1/2